MLWLVSCTLLYAESIENKYLKVLYTSGKVSIESKSCSKVVVSGMEFSGIPVRCSTDKVKDEIWGEASQMNVECDNGYKFSFRLYEENPFVYIHLMVTNPSEKELRMKEMKVFKVNVLSQESKQMNSLGTGGLKILRKGQGSYTYQLIAEPDSRNAVFAGWLTQMRGVGRCMPKQIGEGIGQVSMILEFGNYVVAPNKERGTDVAIVGVFEDGREALELFGDYLAKAYNIKLPAKPNLYCTWYHRNLTRSGASNEKMLQKNAAFAKKELAPFGLGVMQIDDHWQDTMVEGLDFRNASKGNGIVKLGSGPVKSFACHNQNFPSGMAYTAQILNKEGFVAGIWFMPFSGDMHNPYFDKNIFAKRVGTGEPFECKKWSGTCIDATSPAGERFLRKRFRTIYNWGYRYFKIDGLHTGAPSENIYSARAYRNIPLYANAVLYNDTMTFVQCFRRGMEILREEAPDVFLMGCCATQNMSSFAPSFGYVDGMRVGPDNDRAREGDWLKVTTGADHSGNLYFLNNKVWYNDPDPYYVRESNPLHKARWMVSFQSVTGAVSTTSMQYEHLSPERLDLIKRGLPTHSCQVRPADILRSVHPQIWTVKNKRMCVVGLFNWKEREASLIKCSFEEMGLDDSKEYEMFDFWENKYLGKVKDGWVTKLDSASCQVLAMRSCKDYPQIISTSRHIMQGLMDIVSEKWDAATGTLTVRTKMVAFDPYELRLIIPEQYRLKLAVCGERKIEPIHEEGLCRLRILPEKTREIEWKMEFIK